MEYLTCLTNHRNLLSMPKNPHRRLIIRSLGGNSLCRLCGFPLVQTFKDCKSCLEILTDEEYEVILCKE